MCSTETIFLTPAAVVRCFGDGGHGDKCKVTREYAFRKGDLFFWLYDWKSTDLYDPQLLTFEEFWTMEVPAELFVGCNCSATRAELERFANWLFKKTLELDK